MVPASLRDQIRPVVSCWRDCKLDQTATATGKRTGQRHVARNTKRTLRVPHLACPLRPLSLPLAPLNGRAWQRSSWQNRVVVCSRTPSITKQSVQSCMWNRETTASVVTREIFYVKVSKSTVSVVGFIGDQPNTNSGEKGGMNRVVRAVSLSHSGPLSQSQLIGMAAVRASILNIPKGILIGRKINSYCAVSIIEISIYTYIDS